LDNATSGGAFRPSNHYPDAIGIDLHNFYISDAGGRVVFSETVALGQPQLGVDDIGNVGIAPTDGEYFRAIAVTRIQKDIYSSFRLTYLYVCNISGSCGSRGHCHKSRPRHRRSTYY
jgi:hypothetical protein